MLLLTLTPLSSMSYTSQPIPFCMPQKMRGDALLEVVLALWLLGTAAWVCAHFQLHIRYTVHAFQYRARALQLLEATAQALESGEDRVIVQKRAHARATKLLPNGSVLIKTLSTLPSPSRYPVQTLLLIEVLWDPSAAEFTTPNHTTSRQYTGTSNLYRYPMLEKLQSVSVAVTQYVL